MAMFLLSNKLDLSAWCRVELNLPPQGKVLQIIFPKGELCIFKMFPPDT